MVYYAGNMPSNPCKCQWKPWLRLKLVRNRQPGKLLAPRWHACMNASLLLHSCRILPIHYELRCQLQMMPPLSVRSTMLAVCSEIHTRAKGNHNPEKCLSQKNNLKNCQDHLHKYSLSITAMKNSTQMLRIVLPTQDDASPVGMVYYTGNILSNPYLCQWRPQLWLMLATMKQPRKTIEALVQACISTLHLWTLGRFLMVNTNTFQHLLYWCWCVDIM
jgi:hypothetical protein